MEEKRVARHRFLKILVNDLGDRHGGLPLFVRARNTRQLAPVNERELAALEQHAAVRARKPAAARRAIGNHLADCKLTGEWLAFGFEVNAGREALKLAAAGVGRAKLRNHCSQIAARLDLRRRIVLSIGLGLHIRRGGRGQNRLSIEQIGYCDLGKRRIRHRHQRFGGRSSLDWSNNRRGKRSNHQQRRAKRSQH